MRLLKNNIALLHPDALFLCSSSNEETTEGDIQEMGVKLAQEITNYINQYCPGSSLGRISFIGHSMGGIIIRSALPFMQEY
jgi:triacylglycerol esterase/lipase EstA (alpha/beta hydrolase family)